MTILEILTLCIFPQMAQNDICRHVPYSLGESHFFPCYAGGTGINHGVEIHQDVIDYAQERLQYFLKDAYGFDQFEFAEPKFTQGWYRETCCYI